MAGFSIDLTGRTALVTGASSGIGRRFATVLAASGANVVVGARRVERLQELKSEIEAAGGRALAVAMDASDEASTVAAYDAAEDMFGAVDTVVANAGINNTATALKQPVEDFDAVFALNTRGVFLTAREGARRMIANGSAERGNGRVVVISSVTADFEVTPGLAAYSASKAAVSQLSRILAREWANRGINVNVIAPGYMQTEINEEVWDQDAGKSLVASFPRKRIMDIETLDPLLLYLCSDFSAQVTGSIFAIDDGQTL